MYVSLLCVRNMAARTVRLVLCALICVRAYADLCMEPYGRMRLRFSSYRKLVTVFFMGVLLLLYSQLAVMIYASQRL